MRVRRVLLSAYALDVLVLDWDYNVRGLRSRVITVNAPKAWGLPEGLIQDTYLDSGR